MRLLWLTGDHDPLCILTLLVGSVRSVVDLSSLRMQFISKALVRFSISSFSVQVSHSHRKADVTSAQSKPIPVFMDIFLSLQMTFSFANEAVATAMLIFISCK